MRMKYTQEIVWNLETGGWIKDKMNVWLDNYVLQDTKSQLVSLCCFADGSGAPCVSLYTGSAVQLRHRIPQTSHIHHMDALHHTHPLASSCLPPCVIPRGHSPPHLLAFFSSDKTTVTVSSTTLNTNFT